MPRINTKTNITLSEEQKNVITQEMAEVVNLIPRESGAFLMADYEDNSSIRFGNDVKEPCACVEINILDSVYKTTDPEIFETVLGKLSAIISRNCNIPENRIFVLFRNSSMWAFEGLNIEKTILKS